MAATMPVVSITAITGGSAPCRGLRSQTRGDTPEGRHGGAAQPLVRVRPEHRRLGLKLQVMEPITVRDARRGDEDALARIRAEVARYYLDLAPDYFQMLDRFAEPLDAETPAIDSTTLHLVAEVEGQVVGVLVARLLPPEVPAKRDITPERGATLRIEFLATAAASRRQGVGTRLVEAAEAWGREAGATVAETTTYHGSPLSVSFWGERMSYEELSVNLRKPL